MTDLVVGFALVLVLEGLLWALSPDTARRLLEMASSTPPSSLKLMGWSSVSIGAFIIWLVRG